MDCKGNVCKITAAITRVCVSVRRIHVYILAIYARARRSGVADHVCGHRCRLRLFISKSFGLLEKSHNTGVYIPLRYFTALFH